MTQQKKTILAVVSGAVLISLVGVLFAYFGAKDAEPNLIGIGEDNITVEETFVPPKQTSDPFAYRKLVKIKNTGTIPCYIRVRLEFSNSEVQNIASFSAENQKNSDTAPDSTAFKSAKIKEGDDYYINNLPDGWVYVWEKSQQDPTVTQGYYYYTKPVASEKETSALISWIRMNYEDSSVQIQAHDVYVYSESVQTVNASTGETYADWKDAWHSFAG